MKYPFALAVISAGLLAFVAGSPSANAQGQAPAKTEADRAWAELVSVIEPRMSEEEEKKSLAEGMQMIGEIRAAIASGKWDPNSDLARRNADSALMSNRVSLKYRELGLSFYERFPDDPRRWIWLDKTMQRSPFYTRDEAQARSAYLQFKPEIIEEDQAAVRHWHKQCQKKLLPAYLKTHQAPELNREATVYFWMSNDVLRKKGNFPLERGQPLAVDESGMQQAILWYGELFPNESERSAQLAERYFGYDAMRPLQPALRKKFITALKASPNAALRKIAANQDNPS